MYTIYVYISYMYTMYVHYIISIFCSEIPITGQFTTRRKTILHTCPLNSVSTCMSHGCGHAMEQWGKKNSLALRLNQSVCEHPAN